NEQASDREVAMPEDAQIHQRLLMAKLTNQKRDKAGEQNCRRPANPGGAKPVVLLSFVENDLQAAEPDRKQSQPNPVQLSRMCFFDVRRVFDIPRNHEYRE